ncbi:unnamed protein product, partial [Meganyctiphanes norvegica]
HTKYEMGSIGIVSHIKPLLPMGPYIERGFSPDNFLGLEQPFILPVHTSGQGLVTSYPVVSRDKGHLPVENVDGKLETTIHVPIGSWGRQHFLWDDAAAWQPDHQQPVSSLAQHQHGLGLPTSPSPPSIHTLNWVPAEHKHSHMQTHLQGLGSKADISLKQRANSHNTFLKPWLNKKTLMLNSHAWEEKGLLENKIDNQKEKQEQYSHKFNRKEAKRKSKRRQLRYNNNIKKARNSKKKKVSYKKITIDNDRLRLINGSDKKPNFDK